MKKISLFGITLLSVAVLGACSSNSSSDSSSSSSSSSTTTEQTTSGSSVESTEQTTTYPSSAYVSYPYTIDVPSGNSYVIKNVKRNRIKNKNHNMYSINSIHVYNIKHNIWNW